MSFLALETSLATAPAKFAITGNFFYFCPEIERRESVMKSGGDMKRTPRVRLLTREELALWRHVTADVTPRVKRSVGQEVEAVAAESNPLQPKPGDFAQNGAQSPQTKVKAPRPVLNPIVPLDRRLKRKLFSGKAHVDDKIDLHGMTQARAHQALSDFLWRAANAGANLVLVVTGKGNASNFGEHHAEDRGVLRRQAPHWLRSSALRAIVLSVEEAGRPHGGSGALYVRLRRRVSE
jgi:DNA-nicking Smr family endonuclease